MDFLRNWIVSITAAAIIGAAASAIAPQGAAQRVVKLCTALVLCFAILRPLADLNAPSFQSELEVQDILPENALTLGQELTARLIAQRSGAYIVSKAQALGLVVSAEVSCQMGEAYPEPYAVLIRCARPEHAKNALQDMIRDDLNIPREQQKYTE